METGLLEYSRGVVAAICAKARKNELGVDDQVSLENDQLFMLHGTLAMECNRLPMHSQDRLRAEAFAGLVAFTRYIIPSTSNHALTAEGLKQYAEAKASELAQEIDKFDLAFESLPVSQSNLARITYSINNFLKSCADKVIATKHRHSQ